MDLLSLPLIGFLALVTLLFSDSDNIRLRILKLKTLLLERVQVYTPAVFSVSPRTDTYRLDDPVQYLDY